MKLTEGQWAELSVLIPTNRPRSDGKGRPRIDNRSVLEGILWVLKTGARWMDLPKDRFPSFQTCHRRFQEWVNSGVFFQMVQVLAEHLRDHGGLDLTETYIDAMFVEAKKGGTKSVQPSVVRAAKSWQSQTVTLFLSPYMLRVLHHMRVDLLKKRFGDDIVGTYLSELWVTKLTIQMNSTQRFGTSLESNSLLPTKQIESRKRLKMADLCEDIDEDGESNDFFLGSNSFEE